MQNYLGDEFDGVISGVASFGFWVETVEHKCEGLVSINSLLEYDDFQHVESEYSLVGRRSGRQFRMGDKVTIKVVAANLTKRQLDYEWVITAAEKDAFGSYVAAEAEGGGTPGKPARRPEGGGGHRAGSGPHKAGARQHRGGGDRQKSGGDGRHKGERSASRKPDAAGGASSDKRRKKKK
jgi:ribonuclease R